MRDAMAGGGSAWFIQCLRAHWDPCTWRFLEFVSIMVWNVRLWWMPLLLGAAASSSSFIVLFVSLSLVRWCCWFHSHRHRRNAYLGFFSIDSAVVLKFSNSFDWVSFTLNNVRVFCSHYLPVHCIRRLEFRWINHRLGIGCFGKTLGLNLWWKRNADIFVNEMFKRKATLARAVSIHGHAHHSPKWATTNKRNDSQCWTANRRSVWLIVVHFNSFTASDRKSWAGIPKCSATQCAETTHTWTDASCKKIVTELKMKMPMVSF